MTIAVLVELTTICCSDCGGTYAIAENFRAEAQRLGSFKKCWNCPYCKTSRGFGDDEMGKLRARLAREEAARADAEGRVKIQREWRERVERRLSATQGVITRTKRRIANGVCPCCKRSFTDSGLARHIKTKHPEYEKSDHVA